MGALSLGVKLSDREVDHSPLFSAEFQKAWSYTSTPTYVFMLCRGSSVCIETKVRAGRPGFNSRQGQWWNFSPYRLWSPPIILSNGHRGILPRG